MLRLLVIVVSLARRVIRAARRSLPAVLVWQFVFVSRDGFAQELVLQGSLVTMADDGVIEDGSVWIRDGVIDGVFETEAALEEAVGTKEVARLRTKAWIFPGFINLHTHLPFNHQPLWAADKKFDNRYQWQVYPPHVRAVMTPAEILLGAHEYNLLNEQTLFAEVRALVGGTTALASTGIPGTYSEPDRLVRNIEHEPTISGLVVAHVREINDTFIRENAPALRASLDSGELRAWVAHIAEGIDERSRQEFERLERAGLIRKEVVVVHGTGLGPAELAELGRVAGHLVWAPTSNFLLYGQTADVGFAIASGVTISLSNDWSPSGTHNLLAELKVAAASWEHRYGTPIEPKRLVEMITTNPAQAIGWSVRAGKVAAGIRGDLVVVARRGLDPYADLVRATEEDIELVLVEGRAIIGREDWMAALAPEGTERLEATGRNGERYVRRIDVTQSLGDMTLALASARLRRALRFDPDDMIDSFLDDAGRPMTRATLMDYLEDERAGLQPETLPPIFLSDDDAFFERLRGMEFPFADALETVYRPWAGEP